MSFNNPYTIPGNRLDKAINQYEKHGRLIDVMFHDYSNWNNEGS